MPGRRELIMNCSADKTGTAGEQHLHVDWLAGCGTGKANLEAAASIDVAYRDLTAVRLDHAAGDR